MIATSSVEDRVEEATLRLLRTRGPRQVTVEAVAKSSGVAKTTIYRRYRNRTDLMTAALSRLTSLEPLNPRTSPSDRLRWVITHAIEMVEQGVGLGGVATMLTNDDPEFTVMCRQILITQRAQLSAAIEMSKKDGAMRDDIDAATLIDAIVGAYIAGHARTDAVDDELENRLFHLFRPTVLRK